MNWRDCFVGLIGLVILGLVVGCSAGQPETITAPPFAGPTDAPTYKDGTYTAETGLDLEGYWSKGQIVVKDSRISQLQWGIYDSYRDDRIFDRSYERVFTESFYQQQCRADLAGLKVYNQRFLETQDLDRVDAISGATWAYKKFVGLFGNLVEQAKK